MKCSVCNSEERIFECLNCEKIFCYKCIGSSTTPTCMGMCDILCTVCKNIVYIPLQAENLNVPEQLDKYPDHQSISPKQKDIRFGTRRRRKLRGVKTKSRRQ